MDKDSSKTEHILYLSEQERAKIRAEMRYAMLVTKKTPSPESPKSAIEKLSGYLSNGFVLLIIGSVITYFLVPLFQQQYEARKQKASIMQECLSQFLLYSNSIWQEYYTIHPLALEVEINKDEYLRYMNNINQIKLKRYDLSANVEALSIVFREDKDNEPSPVEKSLKYYAKQTKDASIAINNWLASLYCTPVERESSPCENFDPKFNASFEYEKIRDLVAKIGNQESEKVATQMVKIICKHN